VALETGRRANWDLHRLFLGAFLLTFASGLQWFSSGAFLGVAVYVVWVLISLGPRRVLPVVSSLVAGGLLFGIPYLVLFVLPDWDLIKVVMNIGWGCDTCTPADTNVWQINAQQYDYFQRAFSGLSTMPYTANLMGALLRTMLPPFVVGTLLLLAVPGMRA